MTILAFYPKLLGLRIMAKAANKTTEKKAAKATAEPEIDLTAQEPEVEEVETLEAAKARLEAELAEVQAQQYELRQQEKEIEGELDSVIHHLEGNASPHSNQIGIMDYLESQKRQRAERVGAPYEPPAVKRSPLDLALARKSNRGTVRPAIPLKG